MKLGTELKTQNAKRKTEEDNEAVPRWMGRYVTPGPIYQDKAGSVLLSFTGQFQKFETISNSDDLYLVLATQDQTQKRFRLVRTPHPASGVKFPTEVSILQSNAHKVASPEEGMKVMGEAGKLTLEQLSFLFNPEKQVTVLPYLKHSGEKAVSNLVDDQGVFYLRTAIAHEL